MCKGIVFVILSEKNQVLMTTSKTTTSLKTIRQWAEEREGKPAIIKGSRKKGSGLLRIDFPGYNGDDTLEKIPWDEWYEIFRENNLRFLYQEKTAEGKESRFFKLIEKE